MLDHALLRDSPTLRGLLRSSQELAPGEGCPESTPATVQVRKLKSPNVNLRVLPLLQIEPAALFLKLIWFITKCKALVS